MNVTVLLGGPSPERPVSLISGKSVADGLRAAGHTVFESDIGPDNLAGLDHPCDVVFPVLHGAWGESGELQEILEARKLKFVGSGSRASHVGMDKEATKAVWKQHGIPVPESRVFKKGDVIPMSAPSSCVVKPIDGGSSIDMAVFKTPPETPVVIQSAIQKIVDKYGQAMVEQFVHGIEITIGILGDIALPPLRIETTHEFFDYTAKYTKGGATHDFDTKLPADVIKKVQENAVKAFHAIGCRDLARVDVIVDADGIGHLLEINTMPGFTPVSLLPEAAGKIGYTFPKLVDYLVNRAAGRE